jgi:hypothetical protein
MSSDENDETSDLVDQYKLYVTMADRISERRGQDNRFYITILSGLFIILSYIVSNKLYLNLLNYIIVLIAVFGIFLCIIWFYQIRSYKQLNSAKFQIIHEMELQLPFQAYLREWEVLGYGKDKQKYFPLTHVEKYIPLLMALPFILLLICSIVFLFQQPTQTLNIICNLSTQV